MPHIVARAASKLTGCTNFTGADDFGRIINPLIVEDQVHGALVQGVGQALCISVPWATITTASIIQPM